MKKECKSASQFIVELAAAGRYHFTTVDAGAVLGSSLPAVRAALRRLKKRGDSGLLSSLDK